MSTVDENRAVDRDAAVDLAAADISLRPYGVGLALLGTVGLLAAFTLAVDKYKILEDPSFSPRCDLNPVLSCGSVMVTEQAEVFGFPNPLMGIIGFSVVLTVGVLLAAGTHLPRLVLVGLAAGSLAGLAFVHWLAFQTLYEINALCPWCLVVWAVTIPTAVWTTLIAAGAGTTRSSRLVERMWNVRYLLVLGWYLVFVGAILQRFWTYWSTLI